MRVRSVIIVAFGAVVMLGTGILIGAIRADDQSMRRHQWEDPDLGHSVAEGVATEDQIWLLGWNGGLVQFDRRSGDRVVLGSDVHDILADGPHLWAVSLAREGSTFEVWDLRDPSLPVRAADVSRLNPDRRVHLVRAPEGIVVLTEDAVFIPSDGDLPRRALASTVHFSALAAADRSGSVFAGRNSGEFGGGLTRIDLRTGDVSQITGMSAADWIGLCEGDFNPSCDPVVGILPDPQRPDCVIAASGQTHMGMTHGKVYRVCGDELTLTYETPNRVPLVERIFAPTDYWRDLSAPIESLTQTDDGWIAMSWGRYFRMRQGQVSEHAIPDFRYWSGLYISEEQDGVIFAVSACCSGFAFDPDHWTIAIPVIRPAE